jgi:hypothetical protein
MQTNPRRVLKIVAITVFAMLIAAAAAWRILLSVPFVSSLPPIIIPPGAIEKEVMITPEEAIAEARKVPGFESEKILQVRALLNDKGEIQYWLVKTDSGTVTVNSEPPPPKVVIPPNTIVAGGTITPEEAARRVRGIKGYENEEILEIYGLTDESGNLQYWSVKTSRGFVTVEAR